jgi:hypothetical protein
MIAIFLRAAVVGHLAVMFGALPQRVSAQAAGRDSLPQIEAAVFKHLQSAVAANDRKAVVAAFVYPFRVNWTRSSSTVVRSPAQLLRRYDEILSPPVRRAILAQHPDSLFYSWRGSMVGRGEVWIDGVCDDRLERCRYGVTAINAPER